MKPFHFIILLIISTSLYSCNTYIVKTEGNSEQVKQFEKIALLNVYIDPPYRPLLPLLDAAVYNSSFSDIYGDVNALHSREIDKLQDYMVRKLKDYSGKEVLAGKELKAKMESLDLEKWDIKTLSCRLDDDDFPKAVISKDGINIFDFSDESRSADYFNSGKVDSVQAKLKHLCTALEVDGIIVVTVSVPTTHVGMFGGSGSRSMFEDLFFFDKNGFKICTGIVRAKVSKGDADDLKLYESVLNKYYRWTEIYFQHLYKDIDPKELVEGPSGKY